MWLMSNPLDTLVLRAIEYWDINIHVVVLILFIGFVDMEQIAVFYSIDYIDQHLS